MREIFTLTLQEEESEVMTKESDGFTPDGFSDENAIRDFWAETGLATWILNWFDNKKLALTEESETEDNKEEPDPDFDAWCDAWCDATNKIDARVDMACNLAGHKEFHMSYSAFSEEDDVPVDNLDEIAIEGKVQFIQEQNYGEGERYVSPVVENPTWLQVAVLANEMINTTGDTHHVFLEGIKKLKGKGKDGASLYGFSMGS